MNLQSVNEWGASNPTAHTVQSVLSRVAQDIECGICQRPPHRAFTLLNYLHTFCTGCIKQWFNQQAENAGSDDNDGEFDGESTCPICRTVANNARANGVITRLVETLGSIDAKTS